MDILSSHQAYPEVCAIISSTLLYLLKMRIGTHLEHPVPLPSLYGVTRIRPLGLL